MIKEMNDIVSFEGISINGKVYGVFFYCIHSLNDWKLIQCGSWSSVVVD